MQFVRSLAGGAIRSPIIFTLDHLPRGSNKIAVLPDAIERYDDHGDCFVFKGIVKGTAVSASGSFTPSDQCGGLKLRICEDDEPELLTKDDLEFVFDCLRSARATKSGTAKRISKGDVVALGQIFEAEEKLDRTK